VSPLSDAEIQTITRPHRNLLPSYVLQALATLIAFPVVMPVLYFRYHTLRYRIDAEGVSASWGLIFRREVYLTYKRIQDIHVKRNLFERWLGIGTVDIQTAAGSSLAELSLEGMGDYEAVRDFLYRRMRGHAPAAAVAAVAGSSEDATDAELVGLLREIRTELEGARAALERRAR
jgi:putative membrane protein